MSDNQTKISILASGSTGNATYIETAQRKILVDAGLSGKKIAALLAQIGRNIAEVDTLLITHEHSDHIQEAGVLARKYQMDVYANEATWHAMEKTFTGVATHQKHVFAMGTTMTLGDIDITSFGVSHDAVAPQFYAFDRNDKRFVMLTDTGYVSERLRTQLANADAYLIESNHDVSLLRNGRYPWSLKQRILGDQGHLSNEDGSGAVAEMIGSQTKRVFLGHLSQENNIKQLAHDTCELILSRADIGLNEQFFVYDTDPQQPTDLFVL